MLTSMPSQRRSFNGSIIMGMSHHSVDRSPSYGAQIHIPEPFVNDSADVIVVHVGNSFGEFTSRYSSVEVKDLSGNFPCDISGIFLFKKVVVELVSCSENFNFGKHLGIFGKDHLR